METHSRSFTFEDWPVEDEDEFVSYAEWLVEVIRDASGAEPETRVTVIRSRGSGGPMPLDEFRARLDEFPFDDMYSTTAQVGAPDGSVWVDLGRSGWGPDVERAEKTVSITGTDKASVEGVKARVRQDGEGRIERLKEAEGERAGRERRAETTRQIIEADAKRERERERSQPIKQKPPEEKAQEPKKPHPSRFKRFVYNPWTIAIGSGVILIFVGLVVAALISA